MSAEVPEHRERTGNENPGVESIAVEAPSQSVVVNNTDFVPDDFQEFQDGAPTFDEAIEMEIVNIENSQTELRRRVSSRLSIKSDELPDYENYENHPVYSGHDVITRSGTDF